MYLARLFIKDYRSISELDIRLRKGKNVIVGRNNAGKSNIIRAIDLVLGESSPTYAKSENITEKDFHCRKVKRENGDLVLATASELFIWCELCRDEQEQLDYEELYRCYGFYVYADEEEPGQWRSKRPVRVDGALLPKNYQSIFDISEDTNPQKLYVNPKLRHQQTFEQQFEDKYCFAFALLAKRSEDGTISKEIRFMYRENRNVGWILAFKAPIRTELLQSAILHSFRDPQNQLRLSSWTWYGKLMKHLTRPHEDSPQLRDAFAKVREVSGQIFEQVQHTIQTSTLHVAFPGAEIQFRLNSETKAELYRNCLIFVDDGVVSELVDKGSGIQSATIIGLFNYYTRQVNTKTSALLCIEEPEIYLHPHARRVISDRLDEFLDGARNQVVLTTHSVEFLRTTSEDLHVILVRKTSRGTSARVINAGEYKSVLLDNNQNEVFFAETVIACEGLDEHIIRAVANELYPRQLDELNVSVVSVSGKDRFRKLVELVTKLQIRCYIVADFDFLLRDEAEERNEYSAKAHKSIVDFGRAFFLQPSIFGLDAQSRVEAIKELRRKIKLNSPKEFYLAKHVAELPNQEEVRQVLYELRNCGICILSGEIEALAKDKRFLSADKKLNLSSVAALRDKISSGTKATEIFETEELSAFLSHVFKNAKQ